MCQAARTLPLASSLAACLQSWAVGDVLARCLLTGLLFDIIIVIIIIIMIRDTSAQLLDLTPAPSLGSTLQVPNHHHQVTRYFCIIVHVSWLVFADGPHNQVAHSWSHPQDTDATGNTPSSLQVTLADMKCGSIQEDLSRERMYTLEVNHDRLVLKASIILLILVPNWLGNYQK